MFEGMVIVFASLDILSECIENAPIPTFFNDDGNFGIIGISANA